jgi:peroxiredoxin
MPMKLRYPTRSLLLALALSSRAEDALPKPDPSFAADAPPGHSVHGDSFDEGPRRRLPLLPGCGNVSFPVTSSHPEVAAYFNQGVAQLHGFWYWEAERSFRTVLQLDPTCLMGHWGMAMANLENEERARKLIAKVTDDALKSVPPREKAWLESARKFFREKKNDNERKDAARDLVKDMERIAMDFPDDLEARAMAVCFIWRNQYRHGIEGSSHLATDALAQQVLAKNPLHPVHHYLIHLWDHERPKQALNAAAMCGPSAPGVAHMWHMPGHIYSDLERWSDSAWQQEAAARVDHAQMIRNRIFPDQIHNFAHNSEWWIRNLNNLGEARKALRIARNMITMPRIPRSKKVGPEPSQSFDEGGSTWQYGRNRLFETILRWELWDEALALKDSVYLAKGRDFEDQWKPDQLLALASYAKSDALNGRRWLASLEERQAAAERERTEATAAAETKARTENKKPDEIRKAGEDAGRDADRRAKQLDSPIRELRIRDHLANGRTEEAKKLAADLKDVPEHRMAMLHLALGNPDKAAETAKGFADRSPRQSQPLALHSWILWETGKRTEAVEAFNRLRDIAAQSDGDLPIFARLQPVIDAAGCGPAWRKPPIPAQDLGEHPSPDSLGPIEWNPWIAPQWSALDADSKPVTSDSLKGRPHILIFFLGNACTHCNQQIKAFADKSAAFTDAGLSISAISTDPPAEVKTGNPPPFPVFSGADSSAFKAFDAWDDFENKPLHATCLIDASGRLRWQHVSYEPFMLPDFLLEEAKRLLTITPPPPEGVAVVK